MLLNKENESQVKFNPGLSANGPSNNWALDSFYLRIFYSEKFST